MTDIATWLGQQLDEDQAGAEAAQGEVWVKAGSGEDFGPALSRLLFHRRHDPARVLREVEAKRRVLARHRLERGGSAVWCAGCGESDGGYPRSMGADGCPELRDMASGYADRPGYKDEWRVGP